MSKQDNYREIPSCASCAHVFRRQAYDCGDELYCTHEAPPRPPCMSVLMHPSGEYPHDAGSDAANKARRKWWEWSSSRQVNGAHICDAHKVRRG